MTAKQAVSRIESGATLMVGGFGLSGVPFKLVDALVESDRRDFTLISNNIGTPGQGLGKMLNTGRIRKAIGTYFTTNPDVGEAYQQGRLEVKLLPQGTFCEAIRAGGSGIPAFYTPTAAETELAEGKEVLEFEGRPHVLEKVLKAD